MSPITIIDDEKPTTQIRVSPSPKPSKKKVKLVPATFPNAGEIIDLIDAVDNWLKSYKSKHNDKSNRQRIRMNKLKAKLEAI